MVIGFSIALFILLLLISIIEISHYYGDNCGIPVHLWLDIYFIIALSKFILIDWIDILVCKYKPHLYFDIEFLKFTIVYSVLLGWVIYGYIIYFSDKNDC